MNRAERQRPDMRPSADAAAKAMPWRRRIMKLAIWAAVIASIILVVVMGTIIWTENPDLVPVLLPILFAATGIFAVFVVSCGVYANKVVARAAKAAEAGGTLCPNCLYDLVGAVEHGSDGDRAGLCETTRCPECGTLCDIPLLRRAWLVLGGRREDDHADQERPHAP